MGEEVEMKHHEGLLDAEGLEFHPESDGAIDRSGPRNQV